MNYISLFAGIGGFDLANNRAGMECVGMAEIDAGCRGVLKRRFPGVPIYNDVREVGRNTHGKGTVDLVCGGFPCQDVSVAGRRAGLTGERSGLWWEFARVIDELEPRWVVIENVPGLLSSKGGRDFAAIVQWLVKRGYGVCWRILDAQYFGVPQRRRRVFIVGSLGSGRSAQVLFESEGLQGDTPTRREAGKEVAYTVGANPSHNGSSDGGVHRNIIAPTLPARNKGGGGLGSDAEMDGALVAAPLKAQSPSRRNGGSDPIADEFIISKPLAFGQTTDHYDESQQTYIIEQNNKVSTSDKISLRADPAQPVIFQQNTRDEVRLMGGDGQVVGALAAQAGMKQQNYIAFDANQKLEDASENVSPTLRHQGDGKSAHQAYPKVSILRVGNGSADPLVHSDSVTDALGTGSGHEAGYSTHAVSSSSGVRRLTPVECERLQGFPDGWTEGQSDSARYRQLGNAVAVPVVEWIARRMVKYDRSDSD